MSQQPSNDGPIGSSELSGVLSALNTTAILPLVAKFTSHPVMISNRDGGTVWVNEAFTRLSGWPLELISGLRPNEFLHGPATDRALVAKITQLAKEGNPHQFEIENYRRDGTRFWLSIDAQPLFGPSQELVGYFSVQSDITHRKQMEMQLRREHRILSAVTMALSTFISGDNVPTMFEFLLNELLALGESEYGFITEVQKGIDGTQWLRTRAMTNIAWDDATRRLYETHAATGFEFRNLNTLFGQVLLSGQPVIANSASTDSRRGGLPEGHPPLNRFLGLPIRYAGEVVGVAGLANRVDEYVESQVGELTHILSAIGLLIDAGNRDRARRETEEALRESEQWLAETGRVAEVGAWRLDLRTQELWWSAQTKRIHDVPDDYVPSLETAIEFYAPQAREQVRQAVAAGIQSGECWDLELPFVTATGRARWVRAIGRCHVEDGVVTSLYGAFQDITDRRNSELERDLLHRQFLQSQKLESIGRLAGGIAHDFNNMLAVILGHSEMALLDASISQQQASHLRAIQAAGQRSADLTQQLLAFARRQHAVPQRVDLNRTATRMLQLLRRSIGEAVNIIWRPGKGLWSVSIDPLQLDQVLTNLCLNARDALTTDGRISITTHNETLLRPTAMRSSELGPGDFVVLTVSDNGTGISETALEHLFEPFNTTKPVGQGSGLGLATIYGIVQQNGGAIDVHSRTGHGTTFHVYFPRAGREVSEQSVIHESGTRYTDSRCVLLVEDEPALLQTSRMFLEQLGHEAITAQNAVEAMRCLHQHGNRIDVVISDLILPRKNGIELARQIEAEFPGKRFVFMSGYSSDNEVLAEATRNGATILAKPFELQQLSRAVKQAQPFRRSDSIV